jgi:hypothetical protein
VLSLPLLLSLPLVSLALSLPPPFMQICIGQNHPGTGAMGSAVVYHKALIMP